MKSYELAIDLGADSMKLSLPGAALTKTYPSFVAQPLGSEPLLCGTEAADAFFRNVQNYRFIRPVKNGVIEDENFAVTLINTVCSRYLSQSSKEPEIMAVIALPGCADESEAERYERIFAQAGIQPVRFIESGMACFRSAAREFGIQSGMIVDIGKDKTEITAVYNGTVVDGCSVFIGGKHIDHAVQKVISDKFGVSLSEKALSDVRKCCVRLNKQDVSTTLISGMSRIKNAETTVRVSARDLFEAVCSQTDLIVLAVNSVYNSLEREAFEHIRNSGVFLAGGCANIYGISDFFRDCLNTGARVIGEHPELAAVNGLIIAKEA